MPNSKRKFEAVFFDIGDTLVSSRQWIDGAQHILQGVRDRGLRLGVISNTANLTRDQLKSYLPDDFSFTAFDEELVLLSSEVDFVKPDPRIFLLAAVRAAAVPSQCLFCGENLLEMISAQQVGFRTVRLGASPGHDFQEILNLLDE